MMHNAAQRLTSSRRASANSVGAREKSRENALSEWSCWDQQHRRYKS